MKNFAVAACVLFATAVVSVSAWAQQQGGVFSAEARAEFAAHCVQSGSDMTLCQCVWNGLRAELTPAQYTELVQAHASQQINPLMERHEMINAACRNDLPAAGRFPGYTIANFTSGCERSGVAAATCACMINGLAQRMSFRDFLEMDLMFSWDKGSEHHAFAQFNETARACASQ